MKRLLLVRHSLPEMEKNKPARFWNLSKNGLVRAEKLAVKLEHYQPKILHSSPEPKAIQTARLIGKKLGLGLIVVEGLREHDRSDSPFYSHEEFNSLMQEFFAYPNELIFGKETAAQALERFRESVNSMLKHQDDEGRVIVSHGTVISLFVSWLTGENAFNIWKNLGLPSFVSLDLELKSMLSLENLDQGESNGVR